MKEVQELFLGVIDDLRQRRLLPVAIAMVVVAVAIPALMLKPADEAPAPSSAQPATASAASALASADAGKPLVTMAVLRDPSKLEVYRSRNPFKPMNGLSEDAAAGGDSGESTGSSDSSSGGGLPTGGGSDSSSGGSDSESGGSTPSTGQSAPSTPSTTPTTPETTPTTPESKPETQEQEKLTYAIDVTIEGPTGTRRYRSVPRLTTLPSASSPLFVFLGVQDGGSQVTFLVDATLKSVGGEASCAPAPDQCATLNIEPGERHSFVNDAGQVWTVQIDEVREVTVAAASAAARKRSKQDVRAAHASATPVKRFQLPVLTDLFTKGQR